MAERGSTTNDLALAICAIAVLIGFWNMIGAIAEAVTR